MKYCLIFVFSMFLATLGVNASTYTPTDNLFESTQSNYLIQMANSQIDNFTSLDYVIFQVDNNYYLVTGKEGIVNNNSINFNQSTIISAIRTNGSYYNYYNYNIFEENSTTINLSYVVLSNVDSNKCVSSSLFEEYRFRVDLVNIGIFILGLCFAIFVTKERRY